ncbi:MAG: DUF6100 family protein [Coprococcus sp.]
MNNKTIYERLQQIEDEIQRLNNTLFALKTTDIKVYGKRYEELSTSAALRSERITCQLRNLVFTTFFQWKIRLSETGCRCTGNPNFQFRTNTNHYTTWSFTQTEGKNQYCFPT